MEANALFESFSKVLGVNDRLQCQKLQCWHACSWRHFNDCEDLVRSLGVYNMWPSVIGTAMNGLQVYEHITYDDHKHMSIASFPDMQQRSIVTSSLSKTFSVTGVQTLCQFSQSLLFILLGKTVWSICRVAPNRWELISYYVTYGGTACSWRLAYWLGNCTTSSKCCNWQHSCEADRLCPSSFPRGSFGCTSELAKFLYTTKAGKCFVSHVHHNSCVLLS